MVAFRGFRCSSGRDVLVRPLEALPLFEACLAYTGVLDIPEE
jgi:hypothetical protein